MDYSNLFQYFYQCAMVLTLAENSNFFVYLFVNFFLQIIIMTGEPTHTASQNGTACPSYINYRLKNEVSITLCCQLCSTRYTAFWIKNCSKSSTTIHAYRKKEMVLHVPVKSIIVWICYASLSAMFNPLHSSTNQELFKKHLCNQNSHNENTDNFSITNGIHYVLPPNQHFLLSAKINGTQGGHW